MIGLVDCNNFYVSCERVFNPTLCHRAVVVLSSNDGCVIARSNEAKALGIAMGIPAFKIRNLIESGKVVVHSANIILYGNMSRRIMYMLREFSPHIEEYSIDEAFLDLAGFDSTQLASEGLALVRRIGRGVGIPVSLGIAPTKTLAKIAAGRAKREAQHKGVYILTDHDDIVTSLRNTSIGDVWGIGRKWSERLHSRGIHSAYDFSRIPRGWVRQEMTVEGERIWQELNGTPCLSVENMPSSRKSTSSTRSFSHPITSLTELSEAIATFAATCARRLRAEQGCAATMQVFVESSRFASPLERYYNSHLIELATPTNSTIELVQAANEALHHIFREGVDYKRAGVVITRIIPQEQVQLNLFSVTNPERHRKLMQHIDAYNKKEGNEAIKLAAQGTSNKAWHPKTEHLSPRYTTHFKEILKVK